MKRNLLLLAIMFLCVPLSAQTGQKGLETALRFEQEQRYSQAITQYETLITSNPDEERLLLAKTRLGRIYLEEMKDIPKAMSYFEDGLKTLKYPDVTAYSRIYRGRAWLMAATAEKDVEAARGEFDSVIRTYPDSQAVPEALFSAAGILELQRKYDEARTNYVLIVTQFPESGKVPLAFLKLGRMLAKRGDIAHALQAYENVQARYQGKEPGAQAEVEEATLLYRLFELKKRSPEIFKESLDKEKSNSFDLEDPYLMYWAEGSPKVQNRSKDSVYSATGENYRLEKGALAVANHPIFYLKDGKREQFDEITSIATNQYGYMVVAARGPNGLFRVNRETGESSRFTTEPIKIDKLAVDSEGNFYALNEAHTELTIFDTREKLLATIHPMSVTQKEFMDFALDAFDNIYLLDREAQFVIIGGLNQPPDSRFRAIHRQQILEPKSSDAKPMKELRALTVSPSGSVFVVNKQYLVSFR